METKKTMVHNRKQDRPCIRNLENRNLWSSIQYFRHVAFVRASNE